MIEKSLLESRLELESALEKIQKAEALIGKKGFKTALVRLRQQAMNTRKNLKELRVDIIAELKEKKEAE